jgi:peptidoglycan/LPS O-acetylase OafA/YrhL
VAALLVVISHVATAFWVDRAGTLGLLRMPAHDGPNPILLPWLTPPVPAFSLGAFGVGLFFLISGFVIPFSFERYRPLPFLAARAVRLLPTYAAGFLIGAGALVLSFWWRGVPFPFAPEHIALHAVAGMRALVSFDRIDGVVWTLEMEIRFYVLCALLAGPLARGRLVAFLAPVALFAGCIAMAAGSGTGLPPPLASVAWKAVTVVGLNAPFLTFMFVGVALNYHYRGYLGLRGLMVLVTGLLALFLGGVALTPSPLTTASVVSYVVALAAFLAAYRLPQAWATVRPIRWLAAVSYPLYAVHAVLGYIVMWHLSAAGVAPDLAMLAATLLAVTTAWILHVAVERPSTALGQAIASGRMGGSARWSARERPAQG